MDGRVFAVMALAILFASCGDSTVGPNGVQVTIAPSRVEVEAGSVQSFTLELTSGLDDATIYYAIDGSEPNPARVIDDEGWASTPIEKLARTFAYEGPIDLAAAQARPAVISYIPTTAQDWADVPWREPAGEIQTAVVVRAVAVHDGTPVATETRTYLVTPEGRDRYTLPVISLATDRDGLFSAERGIYIHGAEGYNDLGRGREWERVAHLEYFEPSGRRPLAQRVGLRIHGGYTRKMAKKSLRVYARGEYGESRLRHAFFVGKPNDDFKRLILRSGGNEQIHSLMRDSTAHTLVEHLAFDTQHYSPVIVFLNGEYWGIHNLRDRFDEHYLETHHGVLRDRVVVLKNGRLNVGERGEAAAYDELLKLARAGRLRTRADFDAWIDLDGFLDYIVAQMYVASNDWPHNNIRWWRYTGAPDPVPGPRDGRWRWMMYDVDRSFGYATDAQTDMVRHLLESREPDYSRGLIFDLLRVAEIRHELIQRIAVHLATTFEPGRVRGHIETLAAAIRPEIDENFARWAPQRGRAYWESQITTLLDFASERPARFREHVTAYFNEVTGTAELEISGLDGTGTARLYTIPLQAGWPGVDVVGGSWRGELFTGVPVVLSAEGIALSRAWLSGNVERVEAARDALRFIMTGPVRVEVR